MLLKHEMFLKAYSVLTTLRMITECCFETLKLPVKEVQRNSHFVYFTAGRQCLDLGRVKYANWFYW